MATRVTLTFTLVLAAACSDGTPRGTTTTQPRDATDASPTPSAGTPGTVTVSTHRRGGTPHHAVIDLVVVSADGKAALTRDGIGEWRVWPTLDGSRPTQRVPIDGALDAAIASTPTGFLVAAIDAADGATLVQLAPDGTAGKRAQIPPDPGIDSAVVIGDRVLVSFADQSIVAYSPDGKLASRLGIRGARIEGLLAAGTDRALALVRKAGATPTFEARWIKVGAKLEWGATVALASPVAPGGNRSLSPDGRLLAYATAPLPPPAQKPTASAPAPSPPPVVAVVPMTFQLAIVDLTTGKALPVGEPNTFQNPTALGFMTATDLMVVDAMQGSRIAIDVNAGTTAAFGDGLPVRTGPTAFAPGVAAGGHLANLVVTSGNGGTVRYLGHKDSAPTTGALSPSGRTAAWLSTAGSLIVERLDEETEHVIMPDNHTTFSLVELVDDTTVIVLSNQSVLQLFDVDSGTALGDTPVTAAAAMQYDADTRLLLVPSGNTVWLYTIDRSSTTPFGKRMVVPETSAFLLDPDIADGAVLLGSDGGTIRRYTMAELTAGVSRTMARENRITLPTPLYVFDRAGRPYNLVWRTDPSSVNGRYLETWTTTGKPDPWNPKGSVIAKVADDIAAVIPAPAGNRHLAYDNRGTLLMYDPRGTVLWSAAMPTMPSRIAWSDDGERLLVVSQAGGEIFDATTGASLERACGWRFMADLSPPTGAPSGIASVCTAPVRR